ncbi:MAG: N-acetyltransferase [Clostridia bacterium]
MYDDEFAEFDPNVNGAYRFCETKMWIAYKDGKIAGRIAGIWHKGANAKTGLKQLRFTRFDVIDDFDVTVALFDQLQHWAREIGMTEIIGPMSTSDLAEEGMLIEGFDKDSTYIEIYNAPYYVEHMEKLGAYKKVDWNCYRVAIPDKIDERVEQITKLIMEKEGLSLAQFSTFKEAKKYIKPALEVLDVAFKDIFGTSPLDEKQMEKQQGMLESVFNPDLATVVLHGDKVIGYGFMWPGMCKVLHKARGSVIPRGLVAYIKAMSHFDTVELGSIGILPEYKTKGAAALILYNGIKGLIKNGVKYAETGPELEDNHNIQNLWKSYEREVVKRHRCWGIEVKSN